MRPDIDENRQIFAPEIWDESEESPEAKTRGRIKQVWFPGVHSDIGGGYPETGLSDLALDWMIKEAMALERPLIVDMKRLKLKQSYEGIQHASGPDGAAPGPKLPEKACETARGRTSYMKTSSASGSAWPRHVA